VGAWQAVRRAEVYFTLRGASSSAYLPPRPEHYARMERLASCAASSATPEVHERMRADGVPQSVACDQFFFDEVAQYQMQHPKLQALFDRLHGQEQWLRPQIVAERVREDAELGRLLLSLQECAGESVSMARVAPSLEEQRVARHVLQQPQ
jgi:hypothetical protein